MCAAEGWNETELPINVSNVTAAINVSEDLLEDDNESTELDGNLSDAKLDSVSLRMSTGVGWGCTTLVVTAWVWGDREHMPGERVQQLARGPKRT